VEEQVSGAIIIVDFEAADTLALTAAPPPACIEVLGESLLARLVGAMQVQRIDVVTILVDDRLAPLSPAFDSITNIPAQWVKNPWHGATETLRNYKDRGMEMAVVMRAAAYAEVDVEEFVRFHRAQAQFATRAFDAHGPLDFWVVTTDHIREMEDVGREMETSPARYVVRGYVNRLTGPRDLRRLVTDGLGSRCQLRPLGAQIRPGVWVGEGAHIHRKARIVAPAFIGHGSRVNSNCLITRGSSVESNSEIDFDTVVEDSSILENSYVGIGLDMTHSVVDGCTLHSLKHNVTVNIADPALIGRVAARRKSSPSSELPLLGLAQHIICARYQRRSIDARLANKYSLCL